MFFKKLTLIFVLFIAMAGLSSAKEEAYKSFAESYPVAAAKMKIAKLGESIKLGNMSIRVIAECLHREKLLYIQFIDVKTLEKDFDDGCDFALIIWNDNNFIWRAAARECRSALLDVARYCMVNNIDVKKFLHRVPKH
jgi:hypothetical protein